MIRCYIASIIFSFFFINLHAQEVSTLANFSVGDDMHFASNGYIYSSEYGGLYFRKIDADGLVDTILTVDTETIGAIEVTNDLTIYAVSYDLGWLGKFKEGDKKIEKIAEGLAGPAGITMDSKGNLFIATNQNHSIIKITPTGEKEVFASGMPLFWPTGITIDPFDNIYTSNMFTGQIVKITPEKQVTVLAVFPAVLDQQPDLAYLTWANNRLYACHFGENLIYEINPKNGDARILSGSGKAGNEDGAALEADFIQPTGIVASNDGKTLFVTDGGESNHRLRKISLMPRNYQTSVNWESFKVETTLPKSFENSIKFGFSLQKSQNLTFELLNEMGALVKQEKRSTLPIGKHEFSLKTEDVMAGIYYLRIRSNSFQKTVRLVKTQ